MRILLVAPFFPPQRAVASLRTHSFAKAWSEAGHDVTVLTTRKRPDQVGLDVPISGFRVVEIDYHLPWILERLRAGERTSRVPSDERFPPPGFAGGGQGGGASASRFAFHPLRWLKRRTGIFAGVREPDATDFWIEPATRWAMQAGPWDAVVSSFGPPAAVRVALTLKRRNRCRTWAAEFRDLWTDHHLYAGLIPFTFFERQIERQALALADRLVTVTPDLARRLSGKCGKPVEVIYNGYDPADFAALDPLPAFPSDGRVHLVYTGTVYERGQDLHALFAAVAAEPSAMLVVATDRPDVWNAMRDPYGLGPRLDLRGPVPRPEALRMQRDASALILLDWRDPRYGVLTGKVFEYLLSEAPIWVVGGPRRSPVARLVVEAGRGLGLGRNVQSIRAAIRELAAGARPPAAAPNQPMILELSRNSQALRFLKLLDPEK
jgi:glycosyltransferase involved in cell wall biosynthesis